MDIGEQGVKIKMLQGKPGGPCQDIPNKKLCTLPSQMQMECQPSPEASLPKTVYKKAPMCPGTV